LTLSPWLSPSLTGHRGQHPPQARQGARPGKGKGGALTPSRRPRRPGGADVRPGPTPPVVGGTATDIPGRRHDGAGSVTVRHDGLTAVRAAVSDVPRPRTCAPFLRKGKCAKHLPHLAGLIGCPRLGYTTRAARCACARPKPCNWCRSGATSTTCGTRDRGAWRRKHPVGFCALIPQRRALTRRGFYNRLQPLTGVFGGNWRGRNEKNPVIFRGFSTTSYIHSLTI